MSAPTLHQPVLRAPNEPRLGARALRTRHRSPRASAQMQAYLAGDDHALTSLFRLLAPRIRRFVQTRIDDPDMIEDVVQQTFVKAHLGRHAFRARVGEDGHNDDAIIAWYLAIARNTAIDGVRSERRHHRGRVRDDDSSCDGALAETAAVDPDPEQDAIDREGRHALRGRVRDAIAALPASQREVVTLHKLEGLSMQQVADRLHVMPGAARVRAHRAYLALERLLAPTPRMDAAVSRGPARAAA